MIRTSKTSTAAAASASNLPTVQQLKCKKIALQLKKKNVPMPKPGEKAGKKHNVSS